MKFSYPPSIEVGFLKAQFTKKRWEMGKNLNSPISLSSILPDPHPFRRLKLSFARTTFTRLLSVKGDRSSASSMFCCTEPFPRPAPSLDLGVNIRN